MTCINCGMLDGLVSFEIILNDDDIVYLTNVGVSKFVYYNTLERGYYIDSTYFLGKKNVFYVNSVQKYVEILEDVQDFNENVFLFLPKRFF